jgi:hypothetical protein
MFSLMGAPKNLESHSGPFESVTDRTRPFLNQCSESKYLEVTNLPKSSDQYLELVVPTLECHEKRLVAVQRYSEQYHAVKNTLEAG